MADVFDVANLFIQLANQSEDDQMTNLKLNKLLYFAQGAYLARAGRPLFQNDIEAWKLGPVVPEIYRKYRVCGKNPIAEEEDFNSANLTESELDAILDVMREFGKYTGSTLVTITHAQGTPWSEAQSNHQNLISQESIRCYFTTHPIPTFQEWDAIPAVEKLPKSWYDPKEDLEWEAYL